VATSENSPKKNHFRLLSRWISAIFLFLLVICLLSPLLLKIKPVQQKLVHRLRADLQCQVLLEDIDWHWFPLPHISLGEFRVEKQNIALHLPETLIYPNWRAIFDSSTQIGNIHLNKPSLQIKLPLAEQSPETLSLPALKFKVVQGNLSFVNSKQSSQLSTFLPIQLTDFSGGFETQPSKIHFSINTSSSFCREIEIIGSYDLSIKKYQVDYQLNQLNMAQCFLEIPNPSVTFNDSTVDLTGSITGQDNKHLSGHIKGDLPELTLKADDKSTSISSGKIDLAFTSSPTDLNIDLQNIAFNSPQFSLSGTVDRQHPSPGNPAIWTLDLKGTDLDAGSIRGAVLDLLGEDEIATFICNIVRDGKAQWATYQFSGPVTDFEYLSKMKIRVGGITDGSIYVPWGDLSLFNARGEISIIDAYLKGEGEGLSTQMGKSSGSNCNLYIDLIERDNTFQIDLDIQADIREIPPVLHSLIEWPAFIHQVNHFSEIEGRATGKLRLGDNLDDLNTFIEVQSMEGTFRYKPIAWPIQIYGGSLHISPTAVDWHNVKATGGEQQVHQSSGIIDWHKKPNISITHAQANIEANTFFQELQRHNLVPEDIQKTILGLSGRILVEDLIMSGPPTEPGKWIYDLGYAFQGLRLTSPMLPYPILFEKNNGRFSQEAITLQNCRAWVVEQPYGLEGILHHNRLSNWSGSLSTTGLMRGPLAGWIKKNNWIPAYYFPALPCQLNDFSISWDENETRLRGTLEATGSNAPPKVYLDLKKTPAGLSVNQALFSHQKQQGKLSLHISEHPEKKAHLTWEGELLSSTLDRLLEKNQLLSGLIKGNVNINLKSTPSQSKASGELIVHGLQIPSQNTDFFINELSLQGNSNQVTIDTFNVRVNEDSLDISGELKSTEEGLINNLVLKTDNLSKDTLLTLTNKPHPPETSANLPSLWELLPIHDWDTFGICNISIEQFHEQKTTSTENEFSREWTHIDGQLEWFVDDGICANVTQATLCGLPLFGRWCSEADLGKKTIVIETDAKDPPQFQDVLPCLGYIENPVQGPVNFKASLQYEGAKWSIGKVTLLSENGRIKKLVLLSKVLSLLNVTELFTGTTLQDLSNDGFSYASMDIEAIIKDNQLILEKAVIQGDGLNLFAKGSVALDTLNADLTLLVAPFKTVDLIVTSVPLVGKAVTGADEALVSIPFSITGNIKDPEIFILPPKAVGQGILDLLTNTVKIPYTIISPLIESGE